MSDTASSSQAGQPPRGPQGPGQPEGSSHRAEHRQIASPDAQPTVISHRPPLSASDGTSPFEKWGLMPGDRLGHFELVEYVGGGGMGRVFRANDTRLARPVALKVLSPDQAADPNTVLRFQNEAQSAARLDHQNIARVHYVGEDRGIPFIVFEFIEGVNMRDLVLKRGPLPVPEALSYMMQIVEGLAHAASRNVVHRDIKPSNILITAEGVAKLIDLGLARLQRLDPAVADLTATGVTLGTFDYISPEQARDPRSADVRSDIYSLGCTLFFMLTGRPPFPDGTVLQKLLQHQGDQPPDVRELRPDVPEQVSRLLRRTLAKDPRHRCQNPAELIEELLLVANQLGLPSLHPSGAVRAAPLERGPWFWARHLPWVVPVVALLGIVAAIDWWSSHREEAQPPAIVAGSDEPTRAEPAPLLPGTPAPAPATVGPGHGPVSPVAQPAVVAPVSAEALVLTRPVPTPFERAAAGKTPMGLHPEPVAGQTAAAEPMAAGISLAGRGETSAGLSGGQATPDPGPPAPTVKPAAKQSGTLVVGDHAPGQRDFPTLAAACSAAVSGESIELRYNGRRQQPPVALRNLNVTIRGADKFQPVVVFQPADTDARNYPRGMNSMIGITGGQLALINVALELDVPADVPAESWSLFEVLGAETVRLEKCSLTIRNPAGRTGEPHPDVAFFRLRAAPGTDVASRSATPATAPPTIELEDCIARGEAVFLHTETCQPVSLSWKNGLLVTSQCLLSAESGVETPRPGEVRQIDLRHLTAVTQHGLCRAGSSVAAPHQAAIRIASRNSIFLGAASAPLVELWGVESVEDGHRWLEWSGLRNFYQGWDTFWSMASADPMNPPEPMAFEAWKAHWGAEREILPTLGRVQWKHLPEAARPPHAQRTSDYLLDDAASNAARGAASDGDDAGMQVEDLPPLPAD